MRRSFKRFRSSHKRRRAAVSERRTERPHRWSVGNFHSRIALSTANGPDTFINQITIMAMIFGRAGDVTTAQGRVEMNKTRFLDIGGVVLDMGWDNNTPPAIAAAQGTAQYEVQHLLVVDRIDNTGLPGGIQADWGLSNTPASVVGSVLGNQEVQDFPSRILFRYTDYFDNEANPLSIASQQFLSQQVATTRVRRSRSLRLRLRLGQDDALCLHQYVRNGPNYPTASAANAISWCVGTIYYRFVQ